MWRRMAKEPTKEVLLWAGSPEPAALNALAQRLRGAVAEGQPLVIDLTEATTPSAAAVQLLLSAAASGAAFLLRRPSRAFVDGFNMLGLFAALMAMPSAGDLVVYGIDALGGHVSFLDEIGAHAGPSPEELHTFVVAPVAAPLPERVDHPIQLYQILVGYQSPSTEPVPAA